MPASPPRRPSRPFRTVAALDASHDLRFEDYRGRDTRVASHLLRVACRHVRREDQQIAFRIVAVKMRCCNRALPRCSSPASAHGVSSETVRSAYRRRLYARLPAPRCFAVSSGFPVFSGIPDFFRGVPVCSPAFPGALPVSRMASVLVLPPGLLSNGS